MKKENDFDYKEKIEELKKINEKLEEELLDWKGRCFFENQKYTELYEEKVNTPLADMQNNYIKREKVETLLTEFKTVLEFIKGGNDIIPKSQASILEKVIKRIESIL